jgi:hypothetical protein
LVIEKLSEFLVYEFSGNSSRWITPAEPIFESFLLHQLHLLHHSLNAFSYLHLLLNLRVWADGKDCCPTEDLGFSLGLLLLDPNEHDHVGLILGIRKLLDQFLTIMLKKNLGVKSYDRVLDLPDGVVQIFFVISSEMLLQS